MSEGAEGRREFNSGLGKEENRPSRPGTTGGTEEGDTGRLGVRKVLGEGVLEVMIFWSKTRRL